MLSPVHHRPLPLAHLVIRTPRAVVIIPTGDAIRQNCALSTSDFGASTTGPSPHSGGINTVRSRQADINGPRSTTGEDLGRPPSPKRANLL